jgi:hypothetical protein
MHADETTHKTHNGPDHRPEPRVAPITSPACGPADLVPRRQLEKSISWSGRERLRFLWYRLRLTIAKRNYANRRMLEPKAPWISHPTGHPPAAPADPAGAQTPSTRSGTPCHNSGHNCTPQASDRTPASRPGRDSFASRFIQDIAAAASVATGQNWPAPAPKYDPGNRFRFNHTIRPASDRGGT